MKKYFVPLFLGLFVGIFMLFGPSWISAFGNFTEKLVKVLPGGDNVIYGQIVYFSFSYLFFLLYAIVLFFKKTFRAIKNKLSFLFFSFLFFSGGLLIAVLFFVFAASMALSGLGSFS